MYDKLIYGKNQEERIVSIEAVRDRLEIFKETKEGTIEVSHVPNRYWILAPFPIGRDKWARLHGDLHYRFGRQFSSREEFLKARGYYRNKDTFSIFDPKEAAMVKDGYTYFKGMKHDEVSILAFDIESTSLEHTDAARVLLIANTFRKQGKITRKLFAYNDYANEGEMLQAWCAWVREINPSIITGHNILMYDFPYLQFIAEKHGVTLDLGRDDSEIRFDGYESKFRKDGSQFYHYHKVHIYGREVVDTLFSALKYDVGRKYESYGLKPIIEAEGLEVENRVFYDASQIRHKFHIPSEWEQIKLYATHDGDDALAVFDLTTPPFFYLTQSVPKSFQLVSESASGSQINSMMMRAYLQDAHSLPQASESSHFEGAIAFGNPGIYRNVFKIDVASLYPNIMLQYEVYDKEKDPDGLFLKLVQTFTARRMEHKKLAKETKDKYYDDLQNAEKIFINSAYGFLGAQGLLFNSPKNAEFVTRCGREILTRAIAWAGTNSFTIVNADTDSISFTRADSGPFTPDDQVAFLREVNGLFPDKIKFENDGYYKTVIVVKAKNYVLYDGTKITYKGSALKASTKEPALKEFIKNILKAIIENETVSDDTFKFIYSTYVKEIMDVRDINRWATRKTVTDNVLNAKRTNEQKVLDAIENSEYAEGDRIYCYFKSDDSLALVENFDGDYNKDKLLEKLFKTALVFDTIIDKTIFVNYKLKKNKSVLDNIYGKTA